MKKTRMTGGAIVLLGLAAFVAPAGAATPAAAPALRLDDALAMARSATDFARRQGQTVSIVIVNREGRVILSQRMDGASFMSLDVAQAKATTAAALGVPTRLLEEQLAKGDMSALSVPGAITIAGGVPVLAEGRTIAAIGVSGGMPKDDEAAAAAGRDHLTAR